MKVNGSFKGINPSDNNSAKKRITKAAILTGVVVGGAALYGRGKKSPAFQKFASTLASDILTPLKQKGVPFNEKIANIGANLKQSIGVFTSKRNRYDDIIDIRPGRQLPALPERSSASYVDSALRNLIYKDNGQIIFDIPIIPDANIPQQSGKILALSAPGNRLALPEKAGGAAGNVVEKIHYKTVLPATPRVIELPGEIAETAATVGEGVTGASEKAGGKFAAAAGASAILAGGVAASKLNNDEEPKVPAKDVKPKGAKETKGPAKTAGAPKSDKVQTVTLNGKEFGGIFEDGIAYDEECEPLTGSLVAGFKSGKTVVLQYEDGVLQKSLIFKGKDDEAPKEIKTYKNGKIHQKFEGITFEDGVYVAKTTSTYRANDSMLQSREVKGKKTVRTKHFKNSLDENGKINGKPIPVMTTSVSHSNNGTEVRKFYAITGDDTERLARISEARPDGTKEIKLVGNGGNPVSTMILNNDRQINWYITDPDSPNDSYIYINNGKVADVTTSMKFNDKEQLMEYVGYTYAGSETTPLKPLEEGETKYNVPHKTTTRYKSKEGEMFVITTVVNNGHEYVTKIEGFENEKDTEPKSTRIYSENDKIVADYSEHTSPITGELRTKLSICKGGKAMSFPTLEKLECADDSIEAYRKADGSVVEIEKDEDGYIVSIATYANEEIDYPECITIFDHGMPVKDAIFDVDGNVVFKSKYSIKPVPKQEVVQEAPKILTKEESIRQPGGFKFDNDTYNSITFYENMWTGKYYQPADVKRIERDKEDAYRITLLNPYSYNTPAYNMLLDQNNTIQLLSVYSSGNTVELFLDEEGRLDVDDLKYAIKEGELKHVGPFKKNIERYQMEKGEVIEFVKREDGTVASIAYYEDETSDTPVCRTFVKGGVPTTDVVYNLEDGSYVYNESSLSGLDMLENPIEDIYINNIFGGPERK